jgi:carbon-monoxide dehydrogenase large subunit
MQGSILGNAVKRVEDPRFIRGEGRFIDDMVPDDCVFLVPVRSTVAHGEILSIDVAKAMGMPGVLGVYTADTLEAGTIRQGPMCPPETAMPTLATGKVRYVGEVVAVVAASSEREATDAGETVWADIEPLDPTVDVRFSHAADAPLLYPELGTNVVIDHIGEREEGLLDDADVVVRAEFRNQRVAPVPLESNGALALPEVEGGFSLWVGTQNIFGHLVIGKILGMERGAVRGRMPDMGGGFGAKFQTYPMQILTLAVAAKLNRPVKWVETRAQNLTGMSHGRAQDQEVEMGFKNDGTIVGLRIILTQDCGAYPWFGASMPVWTKFMATGTYRIPKVDLGWRSVVTNTVPIHAYRGAGRPEASSLIERTMDIAAGRLGIDPVELRKRNLIASDEFPYTTPMGAEYDSGDYLKALDMAIELAGYGELRAEQAVRRANGDRTQIGIGVSSYVEVTAPEGTNEWSRVEVDLDGQVTVYVGTSGHGQGHETAFAQIVASALDISYLDVKVVEGDTAFIPKGGGTGGSRSLQLGGSSIFKSSEGLVEKAKLLMSHLHEVSTEDVTVKNGGTQVAGVPGTHIGWKELAKIASDIDAVPPGVELGLKFEGEFDQGHGTFPFGAHVCVVEIDTETGSLEVRKHVAVDDCGTIFNRILVDGQVHGGVVQGIGQALSEQVLYDEWGNPLTANLSTYLIPTASTTPSITVAHTETPTPLNPLGAKGIGEAGTIGSTCAIHNAVIDALAPLGVEHMDMPATPTRIWEAIQAAKS